MSLKSLTQQVINVIGVEVKAVWPPRKISQLDKEDLQKPVANTTLNGEKLNAFHLKQKIRPETYSLQCCKSSHCTMTRKGNEKYSAQKGRNKTIPICRWQYIENP